MMSPSVSIISLAEETKKKLTITDLHQLQSAPPPSSLIEHHPNRPYNEDASHVVVKADDPIKDSKMLCHDFVAKINFHDVHTRSCNDDVDDDDENDEMVKEHTNRPCFENLKNHSSPDIFTIKQSSDDNDSSQKKHEMRFICDLGYGLPNEARPRKEKIYAIAKQLVTFLLWQQQQQQQQPQLHYPVAPIYIILGKTTQHTNITATASDDVSSSVIDTNEDTTKPVHRNNGHLNDTDCEIHDQELEESKRNHDMLLTRMHEAWEQLNVTEELLPFPEDIISFSYESLNVFLQRCDSLSTEFITETSQIRNNDTVYLSPDAIDVLDISKPPPRNIIIGLLIDRRTIQYNRSVLRANEHHLHSARWPIENLMTNSDIIPHMIHKNEPLNVDCVLEGMQQWQWNILTHTTQQKLQAGSLGGDEVTTATTSHIIFRQSFESAAIQAIQHHIIRHPQRPLHKTTTQL